MPTYTITKKVKPKGASYILFNFKNDPKNGIIDFIDIKKLSLIEDVNRAIIPEEIIEINFPIFDHYFTQTIKSKNGWTFKKLIQHIYKVGLCSAEYLYKYQLTSVQEFSDTPTGFVNTFALISNNKKSDIIKKDGSIYINLHNSTQNTSLIQKDS
jgi:hypothetical protein